MFDGRSEIKRSLHTRDVRVALVQARQFSLAAYQLFDLVRVSMIGRRRIDPNDPSTWPTADDVVGKFDYTVEEDLNTGKRITRIKTDPSSAASVAAGKEMAMAIEARRQIVFGKVATDDPAAIACDEAERASLDEAMVPRPGVAPQADSSPAPRQTKVDTGKLGAKDRERLLSALWGKYAAQQKGANWTKPRTVADYNQKFQTFLDWIGDRPIHWVEKTDYSAFKTWLLSEYRPAKAKPGQPAGLDARSVDKYTTAINGLFKWAQASGFFPEEKGRPTALQTIMSKAAVSKRAKTRKANRNFRNEELVIAFDAVAYAQENQVVHHFWGPLLALFTGARRGELAQLLIRDIWQTPDGLWLIDITDEGQGQNVKNENARRTVPLHPALIEIGFLDYLAEVKAAKRGPELFPGIEANKYAEKGNAIGNAWRRYLILRGLRTKEQKEEDENTLTLHSLRHTSILLLREAEVPYDLRCQMVGHEAEGQHANYGGAAAAAKLAATVIPLFKYPGLDFSKLRYKVGSLAIKKKQGFKRTAKTKAADAAG
jgi:integrase